MIPLFLGREGGRTRRNVWTAVKVSKMCSIKILLNSLGVFWSWHWTEGTGVIDPSRTLEEVQSSRKLHIDQIGLISIHGQPQMRRLICWNLWHVMCRRHKDGNNKDNNSRIDQNEPPANEPIDIEPTPDQQFWVCFSSLCVRQILAMTTAVELGNSHSSCPVLVLGPSGRVLWLLNPLFKLN